MVKVNKNSFKKNTNEQTIKRSFRMKQISYGIYDVFLNQGYGSNSVRVESRDDICTECPDIYNYIKGLMAWKGKTNTSCSAILSKYEIEVTYQPEIEDDYFYPDKFVIEDVKAPYTVGNLVDYICKKYPGRR